MNAQKQQLECTCIGEELDHEFSALTLERNNSYHSALHLHSSLSIYS